MRSDTVSDGLGNLRDIIDFGNIADFRDIVRVTLVGSLRQRRRFRIRQIRIRLRYFIVITRRFRHFRSIPDQNILTRLPSHRWALRFTTRAFFVCFNSFRSRSHIFKRGTLDIILLHAQRFSQLFISMLDQLRTTTSFLDFAILLTLSLVLISAQKILPQALRHLRNRVLIIAPRSELFLELCDGDFHAAEGFMRALGRVRFFGKRVTQLFIRIRFARPGAVGAVQRRDVSLHMTARSGSSCGLNAYPVVHFGCGCCGARGGKLKEGLYTRLCRARVGLV